MSSGGAGRGRVKLKVMNQKPGCPSVGRGKCRVVWSGNVVRGEVVAEKGDMFDWEQARQAIGTVGQFIKPTQLITTDEETETYRGVWEVVRDNKGEVMFSRVLRELLTKANDPFLTVLKMCVTSTDFKEGKLRGVANTVLAEFRKYALEKKLTPPTQDVQDLAFVKFCSQPSIAVLRTGCMIFHLLEVSSRYKLEIIAQCERADFKTAADAAVALEMFDQFSIHMFCLPLLLQDKPSTMDSYLDHSPGCVRDFVMFLDDLTEDNLEKVSSVVKKYSHIKPIGMSKLYVKPVEKMIKKLSEKHNLDPSLYPLTSARRASADLYYWTKQMFGVGEGSLTLVNWRELMERKVKNQPKLQEQLVNNLLMFNVEEARLWAKKFNTPLTDTSIITDTECDEDWETEGVLDQAGEEGEFYQLALGDEHIVFVDTLEKFHNFLKVIEKEEAVGVDAEFMSSNSLQQLSLFQVATDSSVFLLDFETLPTLLTDSDFHDLSRVMFTRPSLVLVGFGIWGDIKLLARTCDQLSNLPTVTKSVLNLETVRTSLALLLGLPPSPVKGLSGLCHSVLGRPLSKTDQISDWSRRPLRPSQLTYAALDAFACLEIYRKVKESATAKGLEDKFGNIMKNTMDTKKVDKKKAKPKEKPERLEMPALPPPLHITSISPGQLRLVCDDMLQGLCKKLRLFGVDCLALDNGQDHLDCLNLAKDGQQPRYVVSRGVAAAKLKKHLAPGHCLDLRCNELERQVEEVFRYFAVEGVEGAVFSRCVLCNGGHYYLVDRSVMLTIFSRLNKKWPRSRVMVEEEMDNSDDFTDLDKFRDDYEDDRFEEVLSVPSTHHHQTDMWERDEKWKTVEVTSSATGESRTGRINMFTGSTDEGVQIQMDIVPKDLIEKEESFWICGKCGKVYWQGSHWGKAQEMVKNVLKVDKESTS